MDEEDTKCLKCRVVWPAILSPCDVSFNGDGEEYNEEGGSQTEERQLEEVVYLEESQLPPNSGYKAQHIYVGDLITFTTTEDSVRATVIRRKVTKVTNNKTNPSVTVDFNKCTAACEELSCSWFDDNGVGWESEKFQLKDFTLVNTKRTKATTKTTGKRKA